MVSRKSYNHLLKVMLKHDVKELTVSEAAARKNATFLDARELREYEVSHIENAIYAGYNFFNLEAINKIAKDNEIIVYCSIGKRSEDITRRLIKEGFTNVSNLYGGIFEWVNQGNIVVDCNNQSTSRIHVYGRLWGRWLYKGEKVYN